MYKVYYQDDKYEVPVREKTKTLYIDANSELAARRQLADRNINIEFVQHLNGAHLEYEQQSVNYKVMEKQ